MENAVSKHKRLSWNKMMMLVMHWRVLDIISISIIKNLLNSKSSYPNMFPITVITFDDKNKELPKNKYHHTFQGHALFDRWQYKICEYPRIFS